MLTLNYNEITMQNFFCDQVILFYHREVKNMNKIGGMFYYEQSNPQENGYFDQICPSDGDLAFTMSGRCGIYYCLEDILLTDTRKVAYSPCIPARRYSPPLKKPAIV